MPDDFHAVLGVLRERVAQAVRSTGKGLKPFAKANGMGETVIRDLVKAHNKDVQLGTLAKIAKGTGVSLVELIRMPDDVRSRVNQRALERAIADALPELPEDEGRRAEYLAATVARVLALPEGLRGAPENDVSDAQDAPSKAAPPRRSTKKA